MSSPKPWQVSWWSLTWREMADRDRLLFKRLVFIHFILSFLFVLSQGILYDEPDYFGYTVNWAKGHPERLYAIMDSKTPMVAVALVPSLFKPFLPEAFFLKNQFFYLLAGRPFMYVFQMLGVFIVCCWLYRKQGSIKWFLPLLLYCFDPLIFSYGMFIGSDLASASLLVATLYAAWRFLETKYRRYWVYLSVFAALAVVTKASMLYLYPLLVFLLLYYYKNLTAISGQKIFSGAAAFILIQLLVINLAYYGKGAFITVGEFPFTSDKFSALQRNLSWLSNFKMPLPAAFIQGIDMLQHHAEIGGCLDISTYHGVWLFDKVSCKEPVWYFYLVTALFKFPLFTWLVVIVSFTLAVKNRFRNAIKQEQLFTWLPLVYFLLILSLANNFQTGIRHAIILLPFLYLAIGPAINFLWEQYKKLFITLLVLNIISVGRYLPNLLSYTNELAWNKTRAFHIFRDSSLDYGQSEPWVKKYIKQHPRYKQPTNLPDTGYFIIPVGQLFSEQEGETKNIAWLRNHFEPSGHYRFNNLLYHVSAKELKEKRVVE